MKRISIATCFILVAGPSMFSFAYSGDTCHGHKTDCGGRDCANSTDACKKVGVFGGCQCLVKDKDPAEIEN